MSEFERHSHEPAKEPRELWICPDESCNGEMVYPLDWREQGPRHWRVVLRCPNCEGREEGIFEQAEV